MSQESGRGTKKLQITTGEEEATWDDLDRESVPTEETADAGSSQGQQPGAGDDGFSQRRERLRDRARSFFGAKAKAKMDDKAKRQRRDRERIEFEDSDESERDYLLTLRAKVNEAGENYMTSLRDSNLLVPGFSDEQRGKEFNAMQHVYVQMMMQGCMRPLSRGVNANSIVQAVGMMVAMRMLSPEFREETSNYLQPLRDKITDRIDNKARVKGARAEERAAERNALAEATGSDEKVDRDSLLSAKWRKRLADMERRERGNREMFTPESAAMTEVALMENAFWRMRDQEQDSDEIYKSYRAMRKHLHAQMKEDGLDRSEIVNRARVIIGQRMESEPELGLMFNGVAHGRIVKSGPHSEQIAGTDRVRTVWTGEFEDHLGRKLPDDGMFTLRRSMDPTEHQVQLSETMKLSMLEGLRRGDEAMYSQSLMGYMVGFAAQRQGLDTSHLPPVLQQRLDQSETMLASMDVDGLSEEKQREVYSNAFTDAMESVAAAHPGIEQVLQRNFGTDWQASLQSAVEDPKGFYEQQRAQAQSAGPRGTGKSGFDWGFTARESDASEYQPA